MRALPISATRLLEALTRNHRSNLHRCESSPAIATASGFKCDRSGTRPILFSSCSETATRKVKKYGGRLDLMQGRNAKSAVATRLSPRHKGSLDHLRRFVGRDWGTTK